MSLSKKQILKWLEEVKDPEIPVLSLVDLGVIQEVGISEETITIWITPTFVGCPALDVMQTDIITVLRSHGVEKSEVKITYAEPWTSDKISEKGKEALKQFGLAPPPANEVFTDLSILEHAICPRCDGQNTELRSLFGATLCRSIHFCSDCRESFEQFKPL